MKERMTLITGPQGQRALLAADKALRIYADVYGAEQKAAQWKPLDATTRAKLIAEARKVTEVDYDAEQSKQYGRPIWHQVSL